MCWQQNLQISHNPQSFMMKPTSPDEIDGIIGPTKGGSYVMRSASQKQHNWRTA